MNKCDEMSYETYPDIVWQDDTAIRVWRECWKVCTDRMVYQMQSRTKLFTEGMKKEYETNEHTRATADIHKRSKSVKVYERQGELIRDRIIAAASASAITQEALGRARRGRIG